ncbi:MAG TPA: lamin tail domain-containing protein [Candidatus Sumerlaeota bacterium]|nr:lamin tail domain-containing protein [Candidatus Sumerlaeota bacterium]
MRSLLGVARLYPDFFTRSVRIAGCWVVVVFLALGGGSPEAQGALLINEFLASNSKSNADSQGEYDDWIEIANTGATALDLAGMYLSDDPTSPTKWQIPSGFPAQTTIPAKGYVTFWADEDVLDGPTHANFQLSSEGEDIVLVDRDGKTVVDWISFGKQIVNVSYGRYPNCGAQWRYFSPPSRNAANSGGYLGLVTDTHFSQKRGIYSSPFQLTITCDTPGAAIYYTTDGSEPTLVSTPYTAPITIDKTTVLRARAILTGWRASNVDTQSYIFLSSVRTQPKLPAGYPNYWVSAGGNNVAADYAIDTAIVNSGTYGPKLNGSLTSLPILSVSTSIASLFSQATGIYSNPQERGTTWERPVSAEWIDPSGGEGFQINAGLRMQGGWFRDYSMKKHSLRLLFKAMYGDSKLDFPFFNDPTAKTSFDTITLRANANDGYTGGASPQFIRDEFGRRSQLAFGWPASHGRYAHLYLNGLYWGVYNTVERPAAKMAAAYFGGHEEDWDAIITGGAIDGNMDAWNRLLTQCRGGMVTNDAYQRIQGNNPDGTSNPAYENLMDIDNYIDYMLINQFLGNTDWPHNNWVCARDRVANTGFKFFMWDSEFTLGFNSDQGTDQTTNYAGVAEPYGALKNNAEFRLRFADHIHRFLFNNGPLTPAANQQRYRQLANEVGPAVLAEAARWAHLSTSAINAVNTWTSLRDWVLYTYFPQRTSTVIQQYRNIGIYPKTDAPEYQVNGKAQHGGPVTRTDQITLTAPTGTIYYNTTGQDPRFVPTLLNSQRILPEKAPKKVFVPTADIGTDWRSDTPAFDDSTWVSAGFSTSTLAFDGVDDSADFGPVPGSSASLTVAFWMKPATLRMQIPVDKLPQEGLAGWTFKARDNGDLWFRVGSETSNTTLVAPAASSAGKWVHVAATYDQGHVQFFINGILQAEATSVTQTVDNASTPLRFGIPSEAMTSEKFAGELDDVRIFNTALDPTQIPTLRDRQEVSDGLVAHWPLDEVADTIIYDTSGNRHTGKISGGAAWTNPGVTGVGFETQNHVGNYTSYIGLSMTDAMYNTTTLTSKMDSCYIRIPFEYDPTQIPDAGIMLLRMRYDDGFYVYLNGEKISQVNTATDDPVWNGSASKSHLDSAAIKQEDFDVSKYIPLLRPGRNMLAIQGLNVVNSADFLISPELVIAPGYFVTPGTLEYKGPLTLDETTTIKARVLNGNEWSALSEATFTLGSAVDSLRITEVMYNPPEPPEGSYLKDDFEFIEMKNIGNADICLSGIQFVEGISFTWPTETNETTTVPLTMLAPGQYVVLARNIAAFQSRYGMSIPVAGPYSGQLSDKGETLWLQDARGNTIQRFTYNDSGDWPGRADGKGSSLEALSSVWATPASYDLPASWRSSAEFGGSPGRPGLEPIEWVKINEILTRTDSSLSDAVELVNVTTTTLDLSGWYLSDSNKNYFKYRIPDNSNQKFLQVGHYVVFDESDFNPTPATPGPNDFSFDGTHGEDAYLLAPTKLGTYRFVDHVEFGAAAVGESFGRWPDSTGDLYPMVTRTLGAANSGPRVGPLILSEIHYNSKSLTSPDLYEFVEIYNPTDSAVDLLHWELKKQVEFTFSSSTPIQPKSALVVVPFNPGDATLRSNFLTAYDLPETVTLVGPYIGQLSNLGGTVRLLRPDTPPADEPTYYPMLLEDEVKYDIKAPWPILANGGTSSDPYGRSLTRLGKTLWGNDAASWTGEIPSPGFAFIPPFKPIITSTPVLTANEANMYLYQIRFKGYPAPTIAFEGLPGWLRVRDKSLIYGVPARTDVGVSAPITVRVTNSQGTATQQFSITVIPAPLPHRAEWYLY